MIHEHADNTIGSLLERYCDGELTPEQRAAFEQALADDEALRRQVELQSRIDATLRGAFAERYAAAPAMPRKRPFYRSPRVLLVAAMLLIALPVGIACVQYVLLTRRPAPPQPVTMQAYYAEAVASGFEPGWVCETDEQFAGTFDYRFGQPMLTGALPSDVELLGLGYARVLSRRTVTVFARVRGEPVLLFVDRATAAPPTEPLAEGLRRFRRELGDVAIYEVSPHDEPRLLEHFYVVERNADEPG